MTTTPRTLRRTTPRRLRAARGSVLLELMLAIGLLVLGLAIVGGLFSNGLEAARRDEIRLRCAQLAELKLAELDSQMFSPVESTKGDFGKAYPQFAWELTSAVNNAIPQLSTNLQLYNVSLTVSYTIGTDRETFTVNTIRPRPPVFDLQADLGLDKTATDALASSLPLPSLQGGSLDLAELKDLNPMVLMQLLPQLIASLGGDAAGLGGLLQDPTKLMEMISGGNLPPELMNNPQVQEQLGNLLGPDASSGGAP